MSLDETLKGTVFLDPGSTQKLTPEVVAAKLRDVSSRSRISWVPEAILRHTVTDSRYHVLRSAITPNDVRRVFENHITSIVERDSFEGPFPPVAHLIVSHVKDDLRLCRAISPEYIYGRFIDALETENLREAVTLFQSTELSPQHRAAFAPEDISEILERALQADLINPTYHLVLTQKELSSLRSLTPQEDYDIADCFVEILKTTRGTPEFRDQIKPETVKGGFDVCLKRVLDTSEDVSHEYFAHAAAKMLHYTVGDDRLRSPDGISRRQINRLSEYHVMKIQRAEQALADGVILSSPKGALNAAWAELEYIEVCTLPKDCQTRDMIGGLKSIFESRAKNFKASMTDRWTACLCTDALSQYPAAATLGIVP